MLACQVLSTHLLPQVRTFKITPRAVNAHAYVNAAFKMEVDPEDGFKVLNKPTILYGGINPEFVSGFFFSLFTASKAILLYTMELLINY